MLGFQWRCQRNLKSRFLKKHSTLVQIRVSLNITIKNVGTGQLNWRLSFPEVWLITILTDWISTNTKSSVVNLSVGRRGRNPDKYEQEVTISSNGGDWVVAVTMRVDSPTLMADNLSLPFDPKTDQKVSNCPARDLVPSISRSSLTKNGYRSNRKRVSWVMIRLQLMLP